MNHSRRPACWRRSAGVQFTHIPYRGSAPAMNDLMGGQIGLDGEPADGDRLLQLRTHAAVGGDEDERSPSLPDVPTFREADSRTWSHQLFRLLRNRGHFHASSAKRWETEIATALQSAPVKEASAIGVRPGTLGAEGYTDLIKGELARWRVVIRDGNIRAD